VNSENFDDFVGKLSAITGENKYRTHYKEATFIKVSKATSVMYAQSESTTKHKNRTCFKMLSVLKFFFHSLVS
jgi:hypothetical protein